MNTVDKLEIADAVVWPLMYAPEKSPEWRKEWQYFVMMSLETPKGYNVVKALNKHKEEFYNLTMTYRRDSDVLGWGLGYVIIFWIRSIFMNFV